MKLILLTGWSSAHFYQIKEWNRQKNAHVFGKCFSPNQHGHGHDYTLQAEWNLDLSTIEIMRSRLENCLSKISESLDHKHLNHEISYFENINPTTENIARYALTNLETLLKKEQLPAPIRIRIYEKADLWAELSNSELNQ